MTLRVTPEMCERYYDALSHTPPFDGWNLPAAEDVGFKVFKRPEWYGYYTRELGKRRDFEIGIGPKVGHTITLIGTLGHEMIHLYMDINGMDTRVQHNRAFRRLAAEVAQIHGFDPMCF